LTKNAQKRVIYTLNLTSSRKVLDKEGKMATTITAVNEDPTWAVQVQRPMISPTKPRKIDLAFINAADEDKVKFWVKMQYGMYAEVLWCAKVGA
jgi:hypothetical protein